MFVCNAAATQDIHLVSRDLRQAAQDHYLVFGPARIRTQDRQRVPLVIRLTPPSDLAFIAFTILSTIAIIAAALDLYLHRPRPRKNKAPVLYRGPGRCAHKITHHESRITPRPPQ